MIEQIRPEALQQWMQGLQPLAAYVLDVREPHELRLASVAPDDCEVKAIPMATVPARLDELDPLRPVACLCHHGARSMQVAMFLRDRGFARVANIAGGIDAWSLERDPAIARY